MKRSDVHQKQPNSQQPTLCNNLFNILTYSRLILTTLPEGRLSKSLVVF